MSSMWRAGDNVGTCDWALGLLVSGFLTATHHFGKLLIHTESLLLNEFVQPPPNFIGSLLEALWEVRQKLAIPRVLQQVQQFLALHIDPMCRDVSQPLHRLDRGDDVVPNSCSCAA